MGGARRTPGLAAVGAGRLATVLLPALADNGIPVHTVVARRAAAARRLARRVGAASSTRLARAAAGTDAVLLAVSDRAIGEVATSLAKLPRATWDGRVVLHCAGALGPAPLAPLAAAGASVGVLHPLQCLGATADGRALLVGARARIEGDPRACAYARRLAAAVGLVALPARPWDDVSRAAYHAAAALVSNDVVALFGDAIALYGQAGLSTREALAALLPLARGTLDVVASGGVPAALTGPAARGDEATVTAHLARLSAVSPDAAEAHRRLSRRLRSRAHRARAGTTR